MLNPKLSLQVDGQLPKRAILSGTHALIIVRWEDIFFFIFPLGGWSVALLKQFSNTAYTKP